METEVPVRAVGGGVRLMIKVSAGSARDGIVGLHDGRLKIAVRAAPERGKANKAVAALLADILGVPRAAISVEAGPTSPRKTILVRGLDLDTAVERIRGLI